MNAAGASGGELSTRGGEPEVRQTVLEDDLARIEELRVRGQVQRITVHSKQAGGKGYGQYEITPPSASRDPSQRGAQQHSQGQRVWTLLKF
jgi:hypothetical protein